MGYAARFFARDPLSAGDLASALRSRRHFAVAEGRAVYDNPDTGVSFALRLEGEGALTLEIEVPRPPSFALEAELELDAAGLEPAVDEGDAGERPFELAGAYAIANAAAHESLLESGEEPIELSSKKLDRAWRWNYGRAEIASAAGAGVMVPPIEIVIHPDKGQACLAAAWDGARPALLPDVDVLLLSEARGRVEWIDVTAIASELESLGVRSPRYRYATESGLRTCGVRHYDATASALASLDAARLEAPELRRVAFGDARSRELMRLALGIDPAPRLGKSPDPSALPAECSGFARTRAFELVRVLGGYTWRSPWRLESIAVSEQRGVVAGVGAGGAAFFEIATGRRIAEVHGDVHAGVSIGISDDGSTVAIGDEGGNLRVFDVDLGASPALELRRLHPASGEDSAAYVLGISADGSVVVGGVGDDVVVLRDGEEPTTFAGGGAVAVSRDLSRLWLGHRLVDVTTEATLLDLGSYGDAFRVPSLSPDGKLLAFGTASGELRVVRLEDGALLSLVSRTTADAKPVVARTIVFTPDGASIAIGDSEGIEVRAAPSLELTKSFPTPAWDAAVSSETIFRVAGERIWLQPLEGHAPPVNDGPIDQLFHSARGPIAVASCVPGENGTGGRAVLWHLPSGAVLRATPRMCPDRINLSPDGRRLCLVNEEALTVLDVGTLEVIAVVESLGTERYVRPLDLDASPDGEHVLVCLEDGTVRMISTTTGEDAFCHPLGVRCAAFTPDGGFIVGGDASRLRLIDSKTGRVEHEIAVDDPRPDAEHVLLGDGDLAVRVVADTGIAIVDLARESVLMTPWPSAREALAASPDGRLVAITVEEDHGTDLLLWESDSRRELDRVNLSSASDAPVSAAFSPDGKRLLVGTSLGAILVFERR